MRPLVQPPAANKNETPAPRSPAQADIDPQLLEQSRAAQALIEGLVAPRVGKSLSQSYAQALGANEEIHMKKTPSVARIDKDIDAVGDKLKAVRKDPRPVLELKPPQPPIDAVTGKGKR